ncbi:hypothetical protein FB567DRAFT_627939 [Paraphoma chrysanthemicola]|uniref:BTB domain-containing protein n=1 Tax=Paraphoma chrysanthemicola TaxID=798071 RepID=A0A8K0R6R4_9PLEO|nr:hypothetical protein FB567DRAFT_627939 [Paraphoma chrysanthemicola]
MSAKENSSSPPPLRQNHQAQDAASVPAADASSSDPAMGTQPLPQVSRQGTGDSNKAHTKPAGLSKGKERTNNSPARGSPEVSIKRERGVSQDGSSVDANPNIGEDSVHQASVAQDGLQNGQSEEALRIPDIELLRGPAVQVIVGCEANSMPPSSRRSYSLPKALLTHYSPWFRALCDEDRYAQQGQSIEMRDVDPVVFELFIEWLYYSRYTSDSQVTSPYSELEPTFDVQAWCLGDKLRSVKFKNYVMERIYDQYVTKSAPRLLTSEDVKCAFDKTTGKSKLSHIFIDLLDLHYGDSSLVQNNVRGWFRVMQDHAKVKYCILDMARNDVLAPKLIGSKESYMEKEGLEDDENKAAVIGGVIVPAKRTAEGDEMRRSPTWE